MKSNCSYFVKFVQWKIIPSASYDYFLWRNTKLNSYLAKVKLIDQKDIDK